MNTDEFKLLHEDLSARVHYKPLLKVENCIHETLHRLLGIDEFKVKVSNFEYRNRVEFPLYINHWSSLDNVKPYLRPMSSMTDEEKEEYCNLQDRFLYSSQYPVTDAYELFDWLNAHHFDYRGLIEKGLALEALEGMYKNE